MKKNGVLSSSSFGLGSALTLSVLALAAASTGCDGSSDGTGGAGGSTATVDPDCTTAISPGDSDQSTVQTALIEAKEGDIVCFTEGTFKFDTELSLDVKNVTLRGAGQEKTTWDFSGQDVGGNGLLIKSDGVVVEKLTVKNTPGDGVRADSVAGITFRNMTVMWEADASLDNGAYGLYPVGSSDVLIDTCVVKGARDAGIYVGQSTNILITNSEAYGNVAGIEIENSTDSEVVGNKAHNNTAGILVFNLPGLPVQDGKRAKVHDNVVEDNNEPNFGEPGTTVSEVPYGVGIMILASDDNEIHNNDIKGNDSVGILMVSYLESLFGTPNDPDFNSFPEGNYLHDNTFTDNGKNPDALIGGSAGGIKPIPSIVWDGCVDPAAVDDGHLVNCLDANETGSGAPASYVNIDMCNDPSNVDIDPGKVTCQYESLPPQN
ncbi:MAG: parallel beta-helix domain-containing protein [Polyangiaceae bacterium]